MPRKHNKFGILKTRGFVKRTKKGEILQAPTKGLKRTELSIIQGHNKGDRERGGEKSAEPTKDKSKEKRRPVPQPRGATRGVLPEQPSASMYVGLSKSGKSTLLKDTLTDPNLLGNYFHTIVMLSPTSDCDSTITAALKLPDENIITNFTEDTLKDIIEGQRKLIKKKGYNWVAKHNRTAMIFDDCIAKRKFLKSKTMLDLVATVRHLLISVFFLIQSYRMVPRSARINMRGIAFFESNRSETDVLLDEEGPAFLSKKEFREVIHHATEEKYSFLFINKDLPSKKRYMKKYTDRFVF